MAALIFFLVLFVMGILAYYGLVRSSQKKEQIEYIWVGPGKNPVEDMKY